MQLAHYSSEEFQFDPTVTYDNTVQRHNRKPNGFWVSVVGEDDWLSWCQAEEFATDRRVEHNVRLSEEANIWLIDNDNAFAAFERLYKTLDRPFEDSNYTRSTIDWLALVEQGFDGIIIAPYRWNRRLSSKWYYGWDCASGCIWNLDAIESVTRMEAIPLAHDESWIISVNGIEP